MFRTCVLLVVLIAQECYSQEEDEPYRGKLIGKFNSYHHQVSGDVYAENDRTLLLVNFNYDGAGDDTFFWAGDNGRPGPKGFIIPNEFGKTNILERYYNAEVRLTLPEGKQMSRLKWLSIFDIGSQNTFGDVYFPEEFEAPAPVTLPALAGQGVSSQNVILVDAHTILIPEFRYDGNGGEVYFWGGVGPQPNAKGKIIPDEDGYLEPLASYSGVDVQLSLDSGGLRALHWLSVWDRAASRSLASLRIPEEAPVPPGELILHKHRASLPNCRQLHRDYQASWEVFGNQITIQLAAKIEENDYMAFGISGSEEEAAMLGADFAVASHSAAGGQVLDYNVTDQAPCVRVLDQWKGVCRDDVVGGAQDYQLFSAQREEGLTTLTYRRSTSPGESMDRAYSPSGQSSLVWALGTLDSQREPAYHYAYNRRPLLVNFGEQQNDCTPFVIKSPPVVAGWEAAALWEPALRVFAARLGPAGGPRGLSARAGRRAAPSTAFYVNGQLAPDIYLRRGLHYTFQVYGGSDPHSARLYHPLIISREPHGGQRAGAGAGGQVLAGVAVTRRGRGAPTAVGDACWATFPGDPRRMSHFLTFRQFNRTLQWSGLDSKPGLLKVSPNSSWPDLVYYHSFTHADMGGRIFIIDRNRRSTTRSAAHLAEVASIASIASLASIAAFATLLLNIRNN